MPCSTCNGSRSVSRISCLRPMSQCCGGCASEEPCPDCDDGTEPTATQLYAADLEPFVGRPVFADETFTPNHDAAFFRDIAEWR